MDVQTTLKQQMDTLHGTLELAIQDCSPATLIHRFPGSTINSIGAIYAHCVFSEDGLLNGLIRGQTPIYYADGWVEKIGLEMPPGSQEPNWTVDYDLGTFRAYAAEVYKASGEYLESMSDAELDRIVDAGFAPPMPIRDFVANVMAWHVATHQGEISALKGAQGLVGLNMSH